MPSYTDQTSNSITLSAPPQRIISLVPSQTELLYDLGLEERVVGITKFCVHPPTWFRQKTRIGGPKSVHIDQVKALTPDLIIANKEENFLHEVAAMAAFCPVWTSDISDLEKALEMITSIGNITGTAGKASVISENIQLAFAALHHSTKKLPTAYLIWQEPYMTVGGDSFINDMLERCGFINIYESQQRYPAITIEDLQKNNCQLLLLSSEPFPFQQSHLDALQPLLPGVKILLVDGEMFSWYGSRLLQAPAYFEKIIAAV